jgi:hypothetical protein
LSSIIVTLICLIGNTFPDNEDTMEQIIKADRGRMSCTLRKMQSPRQAVGGLIPPFYSQIGYEYNIA